MNALLRLIAFGGMRRGARAMTLAGFAMCAALLSFTAGHAEQSPGITFVPATHDDGDGYLDRISVTFNVPMNTGVPLQISTGAGVAGFRVEGYEVLGAFWDPTNPAVAHLTLAQRSTADTGARPKVTYEGPGGGAHEAATGLEAADDENTAIDTAGPALMSFGARDRGTAGLFNATNDEAVLTFSEPATISGATKSDRWVNLERVVQFTNNGGGCPTDGTGSPSAFNFPQPNATNASSPDPIDAPAQGGYAQEWRVIFKTGTLQPNAPFAAAGDKCYVGISPSWTSVVLDQAGNLARHQNEPSTNAKRMVVTPVDTRLVAARTRDRNADGALDGIELTFDQSLEDVTLDAQLSNMVVALDGVQATVSSYTTGTADDAVVVLDVSPSSGAWGTAATPSVSYAKPSSCTATGGSGIKSKVPTPGFRACVASFSVTAADAAGPALLSARTADTDADGRLDRITATFGEAIAATNPAQWKVDGRVASVAAVDAEDARKLALTVPEGANGDTGLLPQIVYTPHATQGTFDAVANQVNVSTTSATADGAAPRIVEVTEYDMSGDGDVDRATVRYSEPVLDADVAGADFTVAGVAAALDAAGSPGDPGVANDALLTLAVEGLDGTDAKGLAYAPNAGSLADAAGNVVAAQTVAAGSVVDAAAPRGVVTVAPSAPIPAGTATVRVAYSEAMNTSITPAGTVGERALVPLADASHTNGWRNEDPTVWEGTVEIAASDCVISTGCAVDIAVSAGQDEAANAQAPSSLSTEIDTVAPQAPTLGDFAAAHAEGESAPAMTVNMFTDAFSLSAAVVAGDAEAGAAQMLLDGAALPGAVDDEIAGGDDTVEPTTSFADRDALQAALTEGTHELGVRVCDDAGNCVTAPTTVTIAVDYTPVAVTLSSPAGGDVVSGGSVLTLAWDADETAPDHDRVDLRYSTDGGESWTGAIADGQPADGSYEWTVPEIDTAEAKVAAVSVDTNGNKAYGPIAEAFVIDSTAPIVSVLSPSASGVFLPQGGTTTIRWEVADASIHRATDPITIEFSTNNGRSWEPINGGTYSQENDGEETWQLPAGQDWDTRVRVTARDAVDRVAAESSVRLVRGVAGYVAEAGGRVVAFGSAERETDETAVSGGNWVRGVAVKEDGTGGYVMSSRGYLYPFGIGGNEPPAKPSVRSVGKGMARDVAIRPGTNDRGYILDAYGRVKPFNGAKAARYTKLGSKRARALVMLPNGRGGYVMDAYGRLYPFAIWNYPMPPRIQSEKLYHRYRYVDVVLRSDLKSGYALDYYGNLKPFGGAPKRSSTGTGSDVSARSLIGVTSYGGYWVDGTGALHRWGSAYGDPTVSVFGSKRARAAASAG